MEQKKKEVYTAVFSVIFILSLLFVFFAGSLAERVSRKYEAPGVYSVENGEAESKTRSFLAVGSILALVSGYGLVEVLLKEGKRNDTEDITKETIDKEEINE